jgi:hypothetical protein
VGAGTSRWPARKQARRWRMKGEAQRWTN